MTRPAKLTLYKGADAIPNPSAGSVILTSTDGLGLQLQNEDGTITGTSANTIGDTHSNFLKTDSLGGITIDRANISTTGATAGQVKISGDYYGTSSGLKVAGLYLFGARDANSGAASSFDFSGIPANFYKIVIDVYVRATNAATSCGLRVQFNSDTSANYYSAQGSIRNVTGTATPGAYEQVAQAAIIPASVAGNNAVAGSFDTVHIEIPFYANTVAHKSLVSFSGTRLANSTGNLYCAMGAGWWPSTAAINQVTLSMLSANFAQYSQAVLYLAE